MAGKQTRAMIAGASTILGKELAEELNNSPAVAWDTRLLDEKEDAEIQLAAAGDEPVVIQPLTPESLEGADLVFFAGEGSTAREHWRRLAKAGAAIVDLTGALEGEPGFLVRCPWVSGGSKPDLTTLGVIPAHPAALMLAVAVDRLGRRPGLKTLSATVLEPASQGGRPALDELHQQTVSLLSFQSVPKDVFDAQVAFNLQAKLGEGSRVRLDAVRATISRHLRNVLSAGEAAKVRFDVVQAPVFHGYTISAMAELTNTAREDELRTAIHGGVVLAEEETEPSNLAVTETGDLLVSVRAEGDASNASAFWLWMAADNLRLAARNAVAAALELMALRPTKHVQ